MALLFTGSNGFLGTNIIPLLRKRYAVLTLDIANTDINSSLSVENPSIEERGDIVFHVAGKARSIPKTEAEQQIFFDINYQGTINLCKGLERSGLPKTCAVGHPIITTDTQGCRECVIDGYSGYLIPIKNSDALVEKLAVLINDRVFGN